MTDAGERLIEAAKEAVAIAKGEQPAARLTIDGWTYVPEDRYVEATIETGIKALTDPLVAKAKALVALLDDAEVNHGGLVGGVTLRAKNDLRLELSKWK